MFCYSEKQLKRFNQTVNSTRNKTCEWVCVCVCIVIHKESTFFLANICVCVDILQLKKEASIVQWWRARLLANRLSDRSWVWGMIHNKIHLICTGFLRPSIALQCRIVALNTNHLSFLQLKIPWKVLAIWAEIENPILSLIPEGFSL